MDLISTMYIPNGKSFEPYTAESGLDPTMPKWCYETATLCDVSTKNIVLFSSAYPLHILAAAQKTGTDFLPGHNLAGGHGLSSSNAGNNINQTFGSLRGALDIGKNLNTANDGYFVFVADLNTPWDIVLVTSKPTEITALAWDLETSEAFVLADSEGNIETWHMKNSVMTEWNQVAHRQFPSEQFLKARFIHGGRRIYVNLDKQDNIYFREKFLFRNAPEISQDFNEQNIAACLLISSTGLAVVIAYPFDDQLHDVSSISAPATNNTVVGRRGVLSCSQSLGPIRGRVRQADISFNKDGQLLVATSNGDPKCPVRIFSLVPRLEDDLCGDESVSSSTGDMLNKVLSMDVYAFPGIFIRSSVNSHDTELDKGTYLWFTKRGVGWSEK